eukprot:358016-Chlamydomonas_euryale.AAC.5
MEVGWHRNCRCEMSATTLDPATPDPPTSVIYGPLEGLLNQLIWPLDQIHKCFGGTCRSARRCGQETIQTATASPSVHDAPWFDHASVFAGEEGTHEIRGKPRYQVIAVQAIRACKYGYAIFIYVSVPRMMMMMMMRVLLAQIFSRVFA